MCHRDVNLQEMFLFFHHVGSRDPAQVVTLGGKCLCLLSLLAGSQFHFCKF